MNLCPYIADGVLIDTGSAAILKKTKSLLKRETVSCAAITHVHEDHTRAAAWIKEKLGIPLYLHENSIDVAAMGTSLPFYRRVTWGNREAFTADPMPEYIETEKIWLDVIDSPGHHRDHVVFYEKNRGWLFTGDLYISRKQEVAFRDENINDAIGSIQNILELDFDTIFCGHSGIHKNGREKFRSKLEFFLELQHSVRSLEKDGLGHEEINRRLFQKKNLWTLISGGEWSSLNMVRTV